VAQKKYRTAFILSILILILMIIASAGGLFIEDLYRDNLWTSSQLRGSDLVRMVAAVPLLAGALVFTWRGSRRALLVWLGLLWMTVYDYAFFVFGAAFNEFFLIYVALFTLSMLALLFALPGVDVQEIKREFKDSTPVKWISAYMLFIAVFLGGMWIAQSLSFVTSGVIPQSIQDSGHPTGVVYALDLSLLVPGMVLGAIWLWQRRPWGYVLGAMMMVKGTVYPLALVGMTIFSANAGVPDAWDMGVFWVAFAVVSLIASGFLFGNMGSGSVLKSGLRLNVES
jgi:hypothetical protein